MDVTANQDLVSALAAACTAAPDADALLAAALPLLVDDQPAGGGARAATVLRRLPDGAVPVLSAGAPLSLDDPDPITAVDADKLTEAPVPAAWAAGGVTRMLVRPLPGHLGALLVGIDDDAEGRLDAALIVLEAGLARLDAEERYEDLVLRVDNAQMLADMGDYDWHIASDTNRWSDQLYRIYGYEPQSFNATYERFLSHIHPDDRERIMGIHQQAYGSGEPYQMIERIVRPDGEVRFLSSNGQVVMDADRNPVRMRGTCIDITDRVLAEQERERSAARFQGLVETSPDAILVIDPEGVVVQANGRATELLGGSPISHPVARLMPGIRTGQAIEANGVDGRRLQLDVTMAELSRVEDAGLVAAFLHDATPRLASEAMAASLREVQVRRRQAIEINDNVVQGLTAAVYALEHGNAAASAIYLQRTLTSARRMMNDLIDRANGDDLEAGDLVRALPSTLDDGPPVRPVTPEVDMPAPPSERRRILIADDTPDVRMLIRMKLEAKGLGEIVGEASDGEEAVAMATELQPDLVLLDLAMPRMDGLQALPLIRRAVDGVKIIVLSGFDEDAMAAKATAAGAARYVEKGVALSDLANVIEDVFESPAPAMS